MIDDTARISELAGSRVAISYSSDDVRLLRSPLVYCWSRNGRARYVGLATRGISRPLNPSHERLSVEQWLSDDRLVCWRLATPEAAADLEVRAILGTPPRAKPDSLVAGLQCDKGGCRGVPEGPDRHGGDASRAMRTDTPVSACGLIPARG